MAEVIVALVLSAAMLQVTYAEDYTVGDSTGWVRPSDSTFYTNWAADKVFHINDTLGEFPISEAYLITYPSLLMAV